MEETVYRGNFPLQVQTKYSALFHALGNGGFGVYLFFVISGMILALPFARYYLADGKPVSIKKYFARRLTRLEPPYILALFLFSLQLAILRHGLPPGYLPHAFASLFYQHNLIYGSLTPANGVSWSLEIEVQFYVLAPAFMLYFAIPNRRGRRMLLLSVILGFSLAQGMIRMNPRAALSLAADLQYFLAGLLFADVYLLDLERIAESLWWDLAALAVFGLAMAIPQTANASIALPFAFILLAVAAFRGRFFRRLMANPWISVIGGMCYSLYLLHFIVIAAIFRLSRRLLVFSDFAANLVLQMLCFIPPVLLVGVLYFVLVERPFMDPNWPSHLWKRIALSRSMRKTPLDSGE
jgi:peptidoglycan/LPS O-acetylase OafA/YrhL